MDSNISIQLVTDPEIIEEIMFHPDIWETIAEDGMIQDKFKVSTIGEIWLGAFVDDECIGVFNFHNVNGVTLSLHVHILPEHRGNYAMKSVKEMWKWFIKEANTDFIKVIVNMPIIYPRTKEFALACGMREEGLNRMSYKKNGEIVGQWLLGITRDEIKEEING